MTIKELLARKENWIQGYNAKNSNGEVVAIHADDACSWCLAAAIDKCYEDTMEWVGVYEKLQAVIGAASLIYWNDDPERSFKQVKEAVAKAGV